MYWFIAGYAATVALVVSLFLTETLPLEKRRAFSLRSLASGYRRVLSSGAFLAGAAVHGFAFMGGILYSAGAADFVVKVMGLGIDDFGWLTVPLVVTGMAGSWASPKLAARWGAKGLLYRVTGTMIGVSAVAAAADLLRAPGFPWMLLGPAFLLRDVWALARAAGSEPRLLSRESRHRRLRAVVLCDGILCGVHRALGAPCSGVRLAKHKPSKLVTVLENLEKL